MQDLRIQILSEIDDFMKAMLTTKKLGEKALNFCDTLKTMLTTGKKGPLKSEVAKLEGENKSLRDKIQSMGHDIESKRKWDVAMKEVISQILNVPDINLREKLVKFLGLLQEGDDEVLCDTRNIMTKL